MNNKEQFLKNVSDYLDIELSEFDGKRILGYLDEYVGSLPAKVEVREIIQFKDRFASTKPCADELIISEAKKTCKEFGVSYEVFKHPEKGKSTVLMAEVRKIFCHRMIQCFNATRNQLINFWGVDHSTISYYMIGKKTRVNHPIKKSA